MIGKELLYEPQQRHLVLALESAGWELRAFEVDAALKTARVTLESFEGRCVTLDIQKSGRSSVTREFRSRKTVSVGRPGDRSPAERIEVFFLGRQSYDTREQAIKGLCDYLAINSPRNTLGSGGWARALLPLDVSAVGAVCSCGDSGLHEHWSRVTVDGDVLSGMSDGSLRLGDDDVFFPNASLSEFVRGLADGMTTEEIRAELAELADGE